MSAPAQERSGEVAQIFRERITFIDFDVATQTPSVELTQPDQFILLMGHRFPGSLPDLNLFSRVWRGQEFKQGYVNNLRTRTNSLLESKRTGMQFVHKGMDHFTQIDGVIHGYGNGSSGIKPDLKVGSMDALFAEIEGTPAERRDSWATLVHEIKSGGVNRYLVHDALGTDDPVAIRVAATDIDDILSPEGWITVQADEDFLLVTPEEYQAQPRLYTRLGRREKQTIADIDTRSSGPRAKLERLMVMTNSGRSFTPEDLAEDLNLRPEALARLVYAGMAVFEGSDQQLVFQNGLVRRVLNQVIGANGSNGHDSEAAPKWWELPTIPSRPVLTCERTVRPEYREALYHVLSGFLGEVASAGRFHTMPQSAEALVQGLLPEGVNLADFFEKPIIVGRGKGKKIDVIASLAEELGAILLAKPGGLADEENIRTHAYAIARGKPGEVVRRTVDYLHGKVPDKFLS